MTDKDDDYGIPTFLQRGHPDCIVETGKTASVDQIIEQIGLPSESIPLEVREAHEDMHNEMYAASVENQKIAAQLVSERRISNDETDKAVKRKLTGAFKSRVAMSVISQVRAGHDTFGKLRKALPDYDDRELRSGIRYAEKWRPMLERRGTNRKPVMHKYHARVERQGKRYSVVTY